MSKKNEELQKQVDELTAKLEATNQELEKAQAAADKAQAQASADKPTFEYEGKKATVNRGLTTNGNQYSVQDIVANKSEIQKTLIGNKRFHTAKVDGKEVIGVITLN